MRLALASQPVRNGDVAWNVRCMEDVLRACSGRADTVVFGESVLQGFDCLRWDYARDCTVHIFPTICRANVSCSIGDGI